MRSSLALPPDPGDDHDNNLVAAGALLALLLQPRTTTVETIDAVTDTDGFLTNQIDVGFSFLRSVYRITIERIPD
jgi:hypothetical protein